MTKSFIFILSCGILAEQVCHYCGIPHPEGFGIATANAVYPILEKCVISIRYK
jgi:hypothetical protein